MQVLKNKINNITVIRLGDSISGDACIGEIELDVDNNYILTEAVEEELANGRNNIIIEMKNVIYIDSSGLGAIFDSYKQVTEKNGQLKILSPNVDVRRVLDITKISKKIDIFNSEEEALNSYSN